jgi:medium-chain acyl-[acyl-carrier-protein] hydrolase
MTSPISRHSQWFEYCLPLHNQALQLFCFPYAGGTAQVFKSWQRRFPAEINLCLVHLPGRGTRMREAPFRNMQLMVEAIASAIIGQVRHPFAFYGHSMGALLAFELARELRKRQAPEPLQLFLSGRNAPQTARIEPKSFNLPEEKFIDRLRELNGTPQELFDDPELKSLFLPVIRADFEVVDTYEYVPGQPLCCPFSVYGGIEDTRIPLENLHGWEKETSATCTVRRFPGDHFFIHRAGAEFMTAFQDDLLDALRNQPRKPMASQGGKF